MVTVNHAADARLVWPDPLHLDPFELVDMRLLEPVPEGNRVQSSAELTLTAFELGELTVPAFEVEVVDAAGATVRLTTNAAVIHVETVGRDEGGDIRDIKGPLTIPFGVVTLLPWLGGLVVLAAASYWLYQRYRRRHQPTASMPVVPPRPAHEIAYEALDALAASRLLELGEVKTYHIRVSDIVRVYVEGRFGGRGDGDDHRPGAERAAPGRRGRWGRRPLPAAARPLRPRQVREVPAGCPSLP